MNISNQGQKSSQSHDLKLETSPDEAQADQARTISAVQTRRNETLQTTSLVSLEKNVDSGVKEPSPSTSFVRSQIQKWSLPSSLSAQPNSNSSLPMVEKKPPFSFQTSMLEEGNRQAKETASVESKLSDLKLETKVNSKARKGTFLLHIPKPELSSHHLMLQQELFTYLRPLHLSKVNEAAGAVGGVSSVEHLLSETSTQIEKLAPKFQAISRKKVEDATQNKTRLIVCCEYLNALSFQALSLFSDLEIKTQHRDAIYTNPEVDMADELTKAHVNLHGLVQKFEIVLRQYKSAINKIDLIFVNEDLNILNDMIKAHQNCHEKMQQLLELKYNFAVFTSRGRGVQYIQNKHHLLMIDAEQLKIDLQNNCYKIESQLKRKLD